MAPALCCLGRVDRLKGYHDINRHPDARIIPGLVLFRWDAPLFFANAEQFHEHVLKAVNNSPTPVSWFVVAAEPVTSVDVTAADMLVELDDDLRQAGIQLVFAEMKDPVKDKLKRFGLHPVSMIAISFLPSVRWWTRTWIRAVWNGLTGKKEPDRSFPAAPRRLWA